MVRRMSLHGYGVLVFKSLWFLVKIRRRYAVSPLMDTAYGLEDFKPFDILADLGSCINLIPLSLYKMLNIGIVEETKIIIGLADGSKAYPTGVVKEAEVSIGRLKFLVDFYVLAVDKDLTYPLLVGREFLATASDIIDYRRS
ncbi:retrovirus-related pol polyprotein from transposon TNT 1-94 [Tanacetum coccineum]